jgi:nitroimidazol reductase NimA-like FMN-containing flavoprotein (pyridoxamine 5'-phosphate oxidase superfamily)
MAKTLSESEALSLINGGGVGHLGCVVKGEPYVVPINYLFEDGAVYGHSLPGRKIRALRIHPRACLQVDQSNGGFQWRSAIAFGRFEEILDGGERSQVLRRLTERFPLLTPVESVAVKGAAAPEVIVFRIRVDRITGVAEE